MQDELRDLVPGLDVEKYYHAWRTLLLLWRNVWNASRTDWSRYRKRSWEMFNNWCISSARRARDLTRFLSNFARLADIPQIGSNQDERDFILELLALPPKEQRVILAQIRNDMPVLSGLVRRYQQVRREQYEEVEGET